VASVGDQLTKHFRNSGAALVRGMVVTSTSLNNEAAAALAGTALSLLGIVQSAGAAPGTQALAVTAGQASVLLETGLTPVSGQVLWLSASVLGRATNIKPSTALPIGVIVDAALYATTGQVSAVVSPALVAVLSGSTPGADWDITKVRYFIVDGDLGNDANLGYIDALPGTNLSATAPGVAIATFTQLMRIVPSLGNGRHAEVVIKRRAGGALYGAGLGDTLKLPNYGYQTFLIRGTDTNATAGCTAWDNTAADRIFSGGQQLAGTNAAGYAMAKSVLTITGATIASPIAITTSAPHGFVTGDHVYIDNVQGVPEANGGWTITFTGASTFTLNGSLGSAAAAFSGAGAPTVTRWKITLAGGGAPGFVDDGTSQALLGMRIRFDAAAPTVALRNVALDIWGNGTDTIIPDVSESAFGTVTGADVFYIEQPGVAFDRLTVSSRMQIMGMDSFGAALPTSFFAACGLRLSQQLLTFGFDSVQHAFNHVGSLGTFSGGHYDCTALTRYWTGVDAPTIFARVGGCRLGNATLPGFLSRVSEIKNVTISALAHISDDVDEPFRVQNIGTGAVNGVYSRGIEVFKCGMGTGAEVSGTGSGTFSLGGGVGTLVRLMRIIEGSTTSAGIFVVQSNVQLNGVEISGCGARPCVLPFGNSGVLSLRGVFGSRGNTGFGIDLADAPAANFTTASRNWSIVSIFADAVCMRGSSGAIRTGDLPILEYTDFNNGALRNVEDVNGNRFQAVSTAPGIAPVATSAAQVGKARSFENVSGGTVPPYRVVRATSASVRATTTARANTAANATGVVGVTLSGAVSTARFLVVRETECWVEFDRTAGHPAPALNSTAFLSIDTAGLAQADTPATAATNQRLLLGTVVAIHPANADIGLVSFNIATEPVLA
jgi:hypothetical protein